MLEQVAITSMISVPIALLVAIYLVKDRHGWLTKITTFIVDILTSVLSIVTAPFILHGLLYPPRRTVCQCLGIGRASAADDPSSHPNH